MYYSYTICGWLNMRIQENRGTGKTEDRLQVEHRSPTSLRVGVTSPCIIQVSTVLRYSFDGASWHLPFFFNLRISLEDSLGYGFTKASVLWPRVSQGRGSEKDGWEDLCWALCGLCWWTWPLISLQASWEMLCLGSLHLTRVLTCPWGCSCRFCTLPFWWRILRNGQL